MTMKLSGIAASEGFAYAKAYMFMEPDLTVSDTDIANVDQEVGRLQSAIDKSKAELATIRQRAADTLGEKEAQVFDAHIMVLDDPDLFAQTETVIRDNELNAESAFKQVTGTFIQMFEAMEDNPYMQERAADIKDVRKRVIAHLLGVTLPNPSTIDEEVIVIAEDLTPSDTAQLNKQFVKAFVTDIGGRTSHSAIMARSLEIPAIVGAGTVTHDIKEGQMLLVDGTTGEVIVEPSTKEVEHFRQKEADYNALKAQWETLKNEPSVTKDGHHVELAANIGTPRDLPGVIDNGAEGVGLYRTEFLYMDSAELPTEEDQYEAYKKVLEGLDGKPVVVRTMDIGGDKELPYLELPNEMNPFLGYRAIRISLEEDAIFRTQLRALLRASVHGVLRIMFPMIATLDELRVAKKIYNEERQQLEAAGVPVSDQIEIGIMIEIPAAALIADQLAKEVDFFSIGTNDLMQYTMAADRMNERVSYLYQPYNPSLLRLIDFVIKSAHQEGKWVGMCGEVAGDQRAVPLLLGMGLDEFSMSATSILKTRALLATLDKRDMEQLAEEALNECGTQEDVLALLESHNL